MFWNQCCNLTFYVGLCPNDSNLVEGVEEDDDEEEEEQKERKRKFKEERGILSKEKKK